MTQWQCHIARSDGSIDLRFVEAASREAALSLFASENSVILKIRKGEPSVLRRVQKPFSLGRRFGIGDQSLFLSQLATLVASGFPIDRSLDLLREQSLRSNQRSVIARMLATVRSGGGLAQAFAETSLFPAYVTGVVRASERGGGLSAALTSLAERLTLASTTRRQMLTALTYPAAIFAATLAALVIVLTLVVPQFRPIFAGQEDKLPSLTQAVLALSNAVTDAPFFLAAILISPFLAIMLLWRSPLGQSLVELHGHRLPLLGLRDQYLAAQFIGILATLLGNGVRIVDALPLVRDAIGSRRWRTYADAVERRIREGMSLSSALMVDRLLPITAIRLIEVGERSGKLAETCAQASAIIGEATRARIERIVALANPIAIITLGGMVAALVGGVMLGIFALGDFAG